MVLVEKAPIEELVKETKRLLKIKPNLNIGISGGLGPTNINSTLSEVIKTLNMPVSVCAESSLRVKNSNKAWDDTMNEGLVKEYIIESLKAISSISSL